MKTKYGERKIWSGQRHRKFNQKLKEELKIVIINGFIKSQRIQSLEHLMRRNTDEVIKIILNRKPVGKKA